MNLEGGPDKYHGRVVVSFKGQKGSVCTDMKKNNGVAKVVCKMLGYTLVLF